MSSDEVKFGNGAPVAGITIKLDGANLTDAGNFGANLQNIDASFVSEVQVQTSNFGADQSNGRGNEGKSHRRIRQECRCLIRPAPRLRYTARALSG